MLAALYGILGIYLCNEEITIHEKVVCKKCGKELVKVEERPGYLKLANGLYDESFFNWE